MRYPPFFKSLLFQNDRPSCLQVGGHQLRPCLSVPHEVLVPEVEEEETDEFDEIDQEMSLEDVREDEERDAEDDEEDEEV